MTCYATLAQLRKRNQVDDAETGDDQRYIEKLRAASAAIDGYCHRSFQPVQATQQFDYECENYLSFQYRDLLALTSISDNAHAISPSSLTLIGAGPYYAAEMIEGFDTFQWVNTKRKAISVVGPWGWHDDYANAWRACNLTGTLDGNTGAITFSGDPATTADAWGMKPAVSAGDLVECESEWLQVMTASGTTGTVLRGQNGTTAAAHSAKALRVYKPTQQVIEACLTWAAYLVTRDDADDNSVKITGAGDKILPPGFPKRIFDLLDPLVNTRV